MHGYLLRLVDPSQFVCSFMPINPRNLGSTPDGIDFCMVYEKADGGSMYAPFVRHPVISSNKHHVNTLSRTDHHCESSVYKLCGKVYWGSA